MKNVYQKLLECILRDDVKNDVIKATAFISDKFTVKATRRSCSRRAVEIVITAGRPNYAERKFIKACKKAGEKFPLKKIQLKYTKIN